MTSTASKAARELDFPVDDFKHSYSAAEVEKMVARNLRRAFPASAGRLPVDLRCRTAVRFCHCRQPWGVGAIPRDERHNRSCFRSDRLARETVVEAHGPRVRLGRRARRVVSEAKGDPLLQRDG